MSGSLWKRFLARLHLAGHTPGSQQSYNAVTVAPTAHCCDAARATLQRPILVRTLPRLPLPGCSMPQGCRCEFREWPDRRIGERRIPGADEPAAPSSAAAAAAEERRQRRERRRRPG